MTILRENYSTYGLFSRLDWTIGVLLVVVILVSPTAADDVYLRQILPILQANCFDCHDTQTNSGDLDLSGLSSYEEANARRAVWQPIFERVDAGQMPPPDSGFELTQAQKATLFGWINKTLASPDPVLGVVDPGQPVLRRLTRLEYNNTVRDLLGLEMDVFIFPERLPVSDKAYFVPSRESMGETLKTSMREYGAKYPVLLPQAGLPGDNRAEHGFGNRGDALNMSPLLLEKYMQLADQIAEHPDLFKLSRQLRDVLDEEPNAITDKSIANSPKFTFPGVGELAINKNVHKAAAGNEMPLAAFKAEVERGYRQSKAVVFDVPKPALNQRTSGQGEAIKVSLKNGRNQVSISSSNPLWMVSFGTAHPSSGGGLIANATKGQKAYNLQLQVEGAAQGQGIVKIGLCVLARDKQSGEVVVSAKMTNGQDVKRTLKLDSDQGDGNTFVLLSANPGQTFQQLSIDGTGFSGDFVLIDDLAFVLNEPFASQPEPASERVAQAKSAQPRRSLEERVEAFLMRAFRRPLDTTERALYLAAFSRERKASKSDELALRKVLKLALSSPRFLFLLEPVVANGQSTRALTDYELATRLSYFLWSSMPDETLFELAATGQLRQPEVLTAQVDRMLDDERVRELSESFAVQWLRLDQLYTAKPDRELFRKFYEGPQGKATLHHNLMTEALLLTETILVEDRSILEFVDANYTWLNLSMMSLYGLEDRYESQLMTIKDENESTLDAKGKPRKQLVVEMGTSGREVNLDPKLAASTWFRVPLPDRTRGGVMTMGSSLLVTSLPDRTSPVKRGAWLLETIFNRPPPEPKVAFVLEEVKKAQTEAGSMTVRQVFEAHRSDPNCSSCHLRIDPPGFSLENFDAIGRWRDRENLASVDATGVWNQRAFNGPAEFKDALLSRKDEFVRGYLEHKLSYALGRKIAHHDLPVIHQMQAQLARNNYRYSEVVKAIVMSHPFQYTRNEVPQAVVVAGVENRP